MSAQMLRLLKVCAALVLAAVALVLWSSFSARSNQADYVSPDPDVLAQRILTSKEAIDVTATYEGQGESAYLKHFCNEVCEVPEAAIVRVQEDYGIVGMMLDKPAGVVYPDIVRKLEEHGWRHVESGNNALSCFVSNNRHFSWIALSVNDYGNSTCVVFKLI